MKSTIERLGTELAELDRELTAGPPAAPVDAATVREHLRQHYGNFDAPMPRQDVVDDVLRMLRRWSVHVVHPRYFGLFNPSVHDASVIADLLVAAFNPQLAAWSHAPAANEIERRLINFLAARIGFDPESSAGHFTSGGAEANQTAVIAALYRRCPAYTEKGLRAFSKPPTIYVSAEAHHSLHKAARVAGLGDRAVRVVPVDAELRLDPGALEALLAEDRAQGHEPVMVSASAGTTGAGVIDPLPEIGDICARHGLWLHVDGAWGGSALLSDRLKGFLKGIERADSVTWDAHKWLSVPMAAGMFFCRHGRLAQRVFSLDTGYMPAVGADTWEPHRMSLQWSRRFIGLKLFMPLAELGAAGMAARLEHQAGMADLLRRRAGEEGFSVVNHTPLPLVCLGHPELAPEATRDFCDRVVAGGRVWVSPIAFSDDRRAIRCCITSFRTQAEDIEILVTELLDAL